MELKYNTKRMKTILTMSFNCTFMELKFEKMKDTAILINVLIVPLWN